MNRSEGADQYVRAVIQSIYCYLLQAQGGILNDGKEYDL